MDKMANFKLVIQTNFIIMLHCIMCSVILLSSAQEFTLYRSSIEHVSLECSGSLHHRTFLKSSLSSFDKVEDSVHTKSINGKLPRCILSGNSNRIILEGTGEINKQTLQNAATLLAYHFSTSFNTFKSDNGFLKLYGTPFEKTGYIKSSANLCQALRKQSEGFKCLFVDVIKNPLVLVETTHSIPWLEIKTHNMMTPVAFTDPFPNLWKFQKYIEISIHDEQPQSQSYSTRKSAQCFDTDCNVNLARDPLLYNHEYWENEILPHKPVKVLYLADTGIAEAPGDVLKLLEGDAQHTQSFEIVFVIYTLDPEDCSSCGNALPQLKQLKEVMRVDRSKLYYINCDDHPNTCSKQNVTGFPTLFAYKTPLMTESSKCTKGKDHELSVVLFHRAYLASNLIDWYHDVNDLGIHYSEPHDFHEGCNVHIIITSTDASPDGLLLDCMNMVCKALAYSECFILQNNVDSDIYIKSVELRRSDGIASVIYEDGVTLDESFARTQQLHQYHGEHHYDNPNCGENPATCIDLISTFIKEHSRVPVTELSPIIFHSPTSYQPLFGNLPILVALVNHDTIISQSSFITTLHEISVRYYNVLAASLVDVDRYPMWVHGMSPKSATSHSPNSWVFQYPRVLIFELHDHKHAKFLRITGESMGEDDIVKFVDSFFVDKQMEPCNGI